MCKHLSQIPTQLIASQKIQVNITTEKSYEISATERVQQRSYKRSSDYLGTCRNTSYNLIV